MARSVMADWFDVWTSGWRTALSIGETAIAASTVIGSRMDTIDAAVRDPLRGDYVELTGMVTEKAIAFSQATLALSRDVAALQREGAIAMMRYGAMMARGAVPGPEEVAALSARSARIARRAAAVPGRALAPVHAKAVANAQRLKAR